MKKYKATDGAQFDKNRAQIYGDCLNKIAERNNGTFKPIDVVEEARNKKNPLHEVFDWDNTTAAEKYRIEQARHLIQHIYVEVKYDHTKKDMRGWISVSETPNEKKLNIKYINVQRVMEEPDLRYQVVLGALEEAEYWRERWNQYNELSLVFNSIKKTKQKLLKKAKLKRANKK